MADIVSKNGVLVAKKKNKNLNPVIITVFVILMLYAITLFIILGWGLLTSLKSSNDFKFAPDGAGALGLPTKKWSAKEIMFGNYLVVFKHIHARGGNYSYISSIWGRIENVKGNTYLGGLVFNSIMYSVVCTFVQTFVCMTSAYMCCKYNYKFSYFIYTMLLVIMTIPLIGTGPSTLEVLYTLGIFDTYFSMILMSANFTGMYFFVYFAFFQSVSTTYMEAAEIDGSSQLMIYLRIMFPLAIKMFGTVCLISFIALWNNYSVPLLYYPTKPTLAYGIYFMTTTTDLRIDDNLAAMDLQEVPSKVACCMILAIPMMILFVALKNVILGNLSMGGLKE